MADISIRNATKSPILTTKTIM